MKTLKLIIVMSVAIVVISCREEAPLSEEGNAKLVLTVLGDTSITDGSVLVPLADAKVTLSSEYGYIIKYTDEEGILTLDGIPSTTYDINARLKHPTYSNILMSGTIEDVDIISGDAVYDTITASQTSGTGITINEIYACGPVNNIYFLYDQYIELYNYSEEIKYLDGMMVMRFSSVDTRPGADDDGDDDIDGLTYAFKFPGSPGEKNYPFEPGTFLVLASKAVNHQNSVATSIDLSGADWEFYNQYSTSDFDNPSVPNLLSMRSDKTRDFMMGITSDIIVMSSGEDDNWEDGIDIDTIIDGVQFSKRLTPNKTLDSRVDKGVVVSPSRYSGQSMQRIESGEDTNNGTSDWEILPAPTPGE
ncbi:MAG: DUF4876 domain-containing protein [Ignavibacteria bacterium]|jgi:hypothetical protein